MRRVLSPYFRLLRLHQPVGIFLLLWPCWWAIALASGGIPSARLLLLFALGATVMRGAGCIINDIADRDFDRHVERTRTRPLASGEVTVTKAAILFAGLLLIALCIALSMNAAVVEYAALSLVLVVAYPFMKRITWWPQAFLGLTFNWGALLGWVAVRGRLELPAFLLYAGGIFWTLGYDTIYAHQDKADDIKIGVKSTALKLQKHSKLWIALFYALAILCWAACGVAAERHGLYYAGLSLVALHFLGQVYRLDIDNPYNCVQMFRSNSVLGLILFLGCYA